MKISKDVQKGYDLAKQAWGRAYARYSNFQVGAALKIKGEDEFALGCNVENVTFGLTICAERTAFVSSQASRGETPFEFIVVVTDTSEKFVTPCGLCLQTMAEFCAPDFTVYMANLQTILKRYELKELLPHSFKDLESLLKK